LAKNLKSVYFRLLSDLDTQAANFIADILSSNITLSQIFEALTENAKQEVEALVNQTISSLNLSVCLI
jgi:hypothetical protein